MLVLALFLAGVCCLLALIGYVYWQETHLPPVTAHDAIIVLGAQVKADGSLSVALERRLSVALDAYLENPQPLIACGAQGGNEPRPEGDVMRDWLIAHGADPALVYAETDSYNTRQNLANAKGIMDALGCRSALVVTSDYHVARALRLCAQLGIPACGAGSPSKPEYFLKNHIQEGLSTVKFALETLLGRSL